MMILNPNNTVWYRGDSIRDVFCKYNLSKYGTVTHNYNENDQNQFDTFVFDGSTSWLYNENINLNYNNGFTVSLWLRMGSPVGGTKLLGNRLASSIRSQSWAVQYSENGTINLELVDNKTEPTNHLSTPGHQISMYKWYHFAFRVSFTDNTTTVDTFINGILASTDIFDKVYNITSDNYIYIGKWPSGSAPKSICKLSDVIITLEKLSDESIQQIYKRDHYYRRKPNLIAHFPFTNDLNDINGRWGVKDNVNKPTFDPTYAKLHNSCCLNNQVDNMITFDKNLYMSSLPQYTTSVWFRLDSVPSGNFLLISDKSYGFTIEYLAESKMIAIYRICDNETAKYQVIQKVEFGNVGKWYNIIVCVDGQDVTCYVNGTKVQLGGLSGGTNFLSENALIIGNRYESRSIRINDFRIYDGILTEEQAREVYLCKILHYDFEEKIVKDGICRDKSVFHNDSLPHLEQYLPKQVEIGYANKVLEFNKSRNSFIRCPQNVKICDDITINLWFYNYGDVFTARDTKFKLFSCTESGGYSFGTISNSEHLCFTIRLNGAYERTEVPSDKVVLGWNMLSCCKKNGVIQTYINGTKTSELIVQGNTVYNETNTLLIGSEPTSSMTSCENGFSLTCLLDNFSIYATGLDASDIEKLYNDSKHKYLYTENTKARLLAHFPFNKDCNDITGNVKITNPTSELPLLTSNNAKMNKSVFFSSTAENNDKIITDLNISHLETLSFSVWVRVEEFNSSWRSIMSNGTERDGMFFGTVGESEPYAFGIRNGFNGSSYLTNNIGITKTEALNKWIHVTVVLDKDRFISYVNGEFRKEGMMATSNVLTANPGTFRINMNTAYPSYKLSPIKLNDLRIYDGILDEHTVREIYKTKVVDYDFNSYISQSGVVKDNSEYHHDTYPVEITNVPKQLEYKDNRFALKSNFNKFNYLHLNDAVITGHETTINAWVYFDKETWSNTNWYIFDTTNSSGVAISGTKDVALLGARSQSLDAYVYCRINKSDIPYGWNMITLVVGNNNVSGYINGTKIGNTAYPDNHIYNINTIATLLNDNGLGPDKGFNGMIGELQVYATKLQDYEINQLYLDSMDKYNYDTDELHLLAHFPFDKDTYENKRRIKVTNPTNEHPSIVDIADSKLGKCLQGDSTKRIITDLEIKSLNKFTVSCWVKITGAKNHKIFSSGTNALNGPALCIDGNNLLYLRNTWEGKSNIRGLQTLEANKWHNVVIVYNNNNVKYYSNGQLRKHADMNQDGSAVDPNLDPMLIIGSIDKTYINDLRFYSGCATEEQVQEIFNTEILHYPCDQLMVGGCVVEDMSIFGNNSSPVSNTNYPVSVNMGAVNDRCLEFFGKEYIDISGRINLKTSLSFAAWIYCNSNTGINNIICSTNTILYLQNSKITFSFLSVDGDWKIIDTTFEPDKWIHVVGTYDGTTQKLFINGKLIKSVAVSSLIKPATNYSIGCYYAGNYNFYDGKIDDIHIYASAISEDTVQKLYKAKSVRYQEEFAMNKGLICHYPLDGNVDDYTYNYKPLVCTFAPEYINNGKIGKALKTNGGRKSIDGNVKITDNMTMSIWVKSDLDYPSDTSTGNHYWICGKALNGATNNQTFFLDWNGTNTSRKLRMGVHTADGSNTYIHIDDISFNHWTLITATLNSGIASLYVNGELRGQAKINTVVDNDSHLFYIGDNDLWTARRIGSLNDLRLYNYALDEAEIKDLYKCKLAHYTFNAPIRPTVNYVSMFETIQETDDFKLEYDPVENTYKYTAKKNSWEFTPTDAHTYLAPISGSIAVPANTPVTFSYTYIDSNMNHRSYIPVQASGFGNICKELNMVPYKRYSRTINHAADWSYRMFIYFSRNSDSDANSPFTIRAGDWWIIKDPQFEIEPVESPYTSNRSTNYTEDVIDLSGYNRHLSAPIDKFPYWTEDSTLGTGCYRFDSKKNQYLTKKSSIALSNEVSISLWFKTDGTISYHQRARLFSVFNAADNYCGCIIDLEISDGIEKIHASILRNDSSNQIGTKHIFPKNKWNHLVVTSKLGGKEKMYLNGKLVSEVDAASNVICNNLSDITIGDMHDSRGTSYHGQIDNIELYSSVLSDDDIRRLYLTKVEITDKEEVIANNFEEKYNLCWYVNQQISNSPYVESTNANLVSKNVYISGWANGNNINSITSVKDGRVKMTKVLAVTDKNWQSLRLRLPQGAFQTNKKYLFLFDASGHSVIRTGVTLSYSTSWTDQGVGLKGVALKPVNGVPNVIPYSAILDKYNLPIDYYSTCGGILDLTNFEIYQTGTDGKQYFCARELGLYIDHGNCIEPGVEVYLSNFRLYDITEEYDRYNGNTQEIMTSLINPNISRKGVVTAPDFSELGRPARYIRNWLNGNSLNTGCHWKELQVFKNGVNIALGKPVTANFIASSDRLPLSALTDGNIGTNPEYITGHNGGTGIYVQIDLGGITDIDVIKLWHYFGDTRSYHDNIVEISVDGINWEVIYDSNVDGEYLETADGKTFYCYSNSVSFSQNSAYSQNFIEG